MTQRSASLSCPQVSWQKIKKTRFSLTIRDNKALLRPNRFKRKTFNDDDYSLFKLGLSLNPVLGLYLDQVVLLQFVDFWVSPLRRQSPYLELAVARANKEKLALLVVVDRGDPVCRVGLDCHPVPEQVFDL